MELHDNCPTHVGATILSGKISEIGNYNNRTEKEREGFLRGFIVYSNIFRVRRWDFKKPSVLETNFIEFL